MVTTTIIGRMIKRSKGRIYGGITFYSYSIGWCKARDDKGKDYWFNSLDDLLDFCASRAKIRYRFIQELILPDLIKPRY